MIKLVLPSIKHKKTFLEALKEYHKVNCYGNQSYYSQLDYKKLSKNFSAYISELKDESKGVGLPEEWVPSTSFWLIDNGEFIGRVSIRHKLSPALRNFGGNIGYDVRPSKREKGYGKKILELACKEAKKIGIKKALITCDKDNIASRKIIENAGGVYEKEIQLPDKKVPTLHFWVDIF